MIETIKTYIGKFIIAVVIWIVVAIILWLVGAAFSAMFPGILPLFQFGEFLKHYNGLIGFLCGLVYFFFGRKV